MDPLPLPLGFPALALLVEVVVVHEVVAVVGLLLVAVVGPLLVVVIGRGRDSCGSLGMGHPLRFDEVELPQLLLVERPGPYPNVVVEMVRTVVVATTRPNFPVGIATDD